MAKVVRGRAGRVLRREQVLEQYSSALTSMLLKQLSPDPDARMMHLGSPGAVAVAHAMAHRFTTGEIVVVVYTYDEMEETRAALAGLGNVEVINDIADLDPDERPYDLMSCIIPYHLGREYVEELLATGLDLLHPEGEMLIAGDKQQGFERQLALLAQLGSRVTPVVQTGQYRIVSATRPVPGGGLRRRRETA